MSFESLRIISQQGIDQTKELHHSLILPQIFMALQKEHEVSTIATYSVNCMI